VQKRPSEPGTLQPSPRELAPGTEPARLETGEARSAQSVRDEAACDWKMRHLSSVHTGQVSVAALLSRLQKHGPQGSVWRRVRWPERRVALAEVPAGDG